MLPGVSARAAKWASSPRSPPARAQLEASYQKYDWPRLSQDERLVQRRVTRVLLDEPLVVGESRSITLLVADASTALATGERDSDGEHARCAEPHAGAGVCRADARCCTRNGVPPPRSTRSGSSSAERATWPSDSASQPATICRRGRRDAEFWYAKVLRCLRFRHGSDGAGPAICCAWCG